MNEEQLNKLPILLTVKEVGSLLRIGRNAAYELIYQKNFPVLIISPRKIRVPKNELINWIKENINIYKLNFDEL